MTDAPTLTEAIEAALTDTPTPAKAIWRKIDCWGPTTVKHRLNELAAAGRAIRLEETDRQPRWKKPRHLYARPAL